MNPNVATTKRSAFIDRRSIHDRRQAHDLQYFEKDFIERREFKYRRWKTERRIGWIRAGKWNSVYPWMTLEKPGVAHNVVIRKEYLQLAEIVENHTNFGDGDKKKH